ncbi:hypothetical protein L211DRAFT_796967 [Terfezia boudieri ATCC MYA-4762]|uniref:DUF676 domain-containing protein n=1 Tax=Terfezia boudieri ATCC MYA-4762 TaxID=1051890 RepID=A0A3N4L6D1_9PEZI|nr:hypothetical protein L211DRAFT_796967 [Terfezia boudieri ATCC MYA-4762]
MFYLSTSQELNHKYSIVAVHGLGSAPKRAWLHKASKKMWLKDFLPEERDIKRSRIMLANHESDWSNNAADNPLGKYSEAILQGLKEQRSTKEEAKRPIIFIAHSFGGILVKRALVIASRSNDQGYRQIYEMTKGVIFLGTPHKGAIISRIGRVVALTSYWMGSSIKLLDLLDVASTHNREIGDDYLDISTELVHIDFYEMLAEQTFGIPTGIVNSQAVPRDRATIDGRANYGLYATHRGINKFPSREDNNYAQVLRRLISIVDYCRQLNEPMHEEMKKEEGRQKRS